MKKIKLILALGLTFIITQQAHAWGEVGHGIVGQITEENLTPEAKSFVRGILGIESLIIASNWPDLSKDDQRFEYRGKDPQKAELHDFSEYHFCEIPVGFSYSNRPNNPPKDCNGAIANGIEILKAPLSKYPRETKMIALRYLIHVVGDIHQPLHIGNNYDRGGNACKIQWLNPKRIQNLHSTWDTAVIQFLGETYKDLNAKPPVKAPFYAPGFVTLMKVKRPELFTQSSKDQLNSTTVQEWYLESQKIRDTVVYPPSVNANKSVPLDKQHEHRSYCGWYSDQRKGILGEGSLDPNNIPLENMPLIEDKDAVLWARTAETQLIKAGLRTAFLLNEIAKEVGAGQPALNDAMESKIFFDLDEAFKKKN